MTPVGADVLQQLYNETKHSISREFLFPNRTPIPDVAGVKEAYLGFLAARTFLSIIQDEDGDIVKSIFYDNVRPSLPPMPCPSTLNGVMMGGAKLPTKVITALLTRIMHDAGRFYTSAERARADAPSSWIGG
jgi:hypothetical protein